MPPRITSPGKQWLWVILAVSALFFGGYATHVAVGAQSMGGIFTAGPSTEVGLGQEVRDGKFVIAVTEVSTSANWYSP